MEYPQRKSYRLAGFDYSSANYYYITICTAERRCLFGTPGRLNALGRIVREELAQIPSRYQNVTVEKYVVMPNHIHVIFVFSGEGNPQLADVVGKYKAGVSRRIRKIYPDLDIWQTRYYDEIIRNEDHYLAAWNYIDGNPSKWIEDKYFTP